jgi:hypothetical protein
MVCRYPRPLHCITDNGNEFLGTKFQELLGSYSVQPIHTKIKNPQANFVERVHQTLGKMILTYELETFELDYNDLWSQILANCTCAICSTAHSILDVTQA